MRQKSWSLRQIPWRKMTKIVASPTDAYFGAFGRASATIRPKTRWSRLSGTTLPEHKREGTVHEFNGKVNAGVQVYCIQYPIRAPLRSARPADSFDVSRKFADFGRIRPLPSGSTAILRTGRQRVAARVRRMWSNSGRSASALLQFFSAVANCSWLALASPLCSKTRPRA